MSLIKPICIIQSPLATRSGYGDFARDIARHIIELDRYDVKLVSLPWGVTPMNALDPVKDIELIKRIVPIPMQLTRQPELFIQISVPNEFQPLAKYNIGITAGIETTAVSLPWIQGCNRMNVIWTISNHSKKVFDETVIEEKAPNGQVMRTHKVTVPVEVLHNCVHTDIFRKLSQEEIPINIKETLSEIKERFCFLFVGHWLKGNIGEDRKNVGMLIKVFCETFKNTQSVNRPALILKTSGAGFSILEREEILNKITSIKNTVGEHCPNVYLLSGELTEEEMNGLYNHPKVKAHVNFTKGEGFCVLPETNIITSKGLKAIKDINSRDQVISHTGTFRSVKEQLIRNYSGYLKKINVYGGQQTDDICLTPNHRVYIFDNKLKKFSWKAAEELSKGDILCLPSLCNKFNKLTCLNLFENIKDKTNITLVNEIVKYVHSDKSEKINDIPNQIKIGEDLGKLIGYYLSEGTVGNGSILFSLHKKEIDTIVPELQRCFKNLFGIEKSSIKFHKTKNSMMIIFYSKIIAKFLVSICGHGATKKRIPQFSMMANDIFKKNLITSIIQGDGSISKKGASLQLVNDALIRDIRMLCLSLGLTTNFDSKTTEKFSDTVSRIRFVSELSRIKLLSWIAENHQFKQFEPISRRKYFKNRIDSFENYSLFTIKNVENVFYTGPVYNLSVDDDESYCLENFTVHNCRPLLEACFSQKPIIAPAWSGQLDFLVPELSILLPGELKQMDPSSVWQDVHIPESYWFNVDLNKAAGALMTVFKRYDQFILPAKSLAKINKEKFNYEVIKNKTAELLDKYVPATATEIPIKLPTLKRIKVEA